MALSTTEPLATCWELTRPRLAARLIADGTGVCFIYLHETRVFGFHKDVSPASTFLDCQKNASSLTSGAVVPLRFCLALKLCHFPCVWCSSEPFPLCLALLSLVIYVLRTKSLVTDSLDDSLTD